MSATADAVIVGGGVMGCSILYNLAMRGITRTVLLERDVLVSGSTGRSQAILRMHYSNEVTTRMAWESLKLFKGFEELTGVPAGYVRTGYFLIVGEGDRQAMRENVAMQRSVGVKTEVLSLEEVREVAPGLLVRGNETCAYEPESGYADPYSVTTGYARRAREMGAQVRLNTAVTDIEVVGGKVKAVVTLQERIETAIAVVAAGPWSGKLFAKLGLEVPLRTLRHQVIMLRRPREEVPDHPIIGDVVNSLSARPDAGGLTQIGVGEEEPASPEEYNQGVDMPVVAEAMAGLVRRMPAMSQAVFRGGWSGLFVVTPDWHPILDKVEEIEGLYCAVGFSGHGFKLSPVVGAVMSEMITQGHATTLDAGLVAQLGFSRFREGKLLRSRYRMNVLA